MVVAAAVSREVAALPDASPLRGRCRAGVAAGRRVASSVGTSGSGSFNPQVVPRG